MKVQTDTSFFTAKSFFNPNWMILQDFLMRIFCLNLAIIMSQIFYYLRLKKTSKFQYVHGNDLNMYTNRGTMLRYMVKQLIIKM